MNTTKPHAPIPNLVFADRSLIPSRNIGALAFPVLIRYLTQVEICAMWQVLIPSPCLCIMFIWGALWAASLRLEKTTINGRVDVRSIKAALRCSFQPSMWEALTATTLQWNSSQQSFDYFLLLIYRITLSIHNDTFTIPTVNCDYQVR